MEEMQNPNINKVLLNGLNLISCDHKSASEYIVNTIDSGTNRIFIHINLNNYYKLLKRQNFIEEIETQPTFFFEGIGMKAAFFISGSGLLKDTNGTDIYPILFEDLSKKEKNIFILGAKERPLLKAVEHINAKYPGIHIGGYHNGFFGINDEVRIVEQINNSLAELLILGMGISKEMDFILRNYKKIKCKAVWNVGGLFDFISGEKPRAPVIMRKARLEWLYRFFIEPREKASRIFYIPLWFIFHLAKNRFLRKDFLGRI